MSRRRFGDGVQPSCFLREPSQIRVEQAKRAETEFGLGRSRSPCCKQAGKAFQELRKQPSGRSRDFISVGFCKGFARLRSRLPKARAQPQGDPLLICLKPCDSREGRFPAPSFGCL